MRMHRWCSLALCWVLSAAVMAGETLPPSPPAPAVKEKPTMNLDAFVVEQWNPGEGAVKLEEGLLRIDTQEGQDGVHVWLKEELPPDFTLEYDFTPLSPSGFFLLFFCQKGLKGEDVLAPELLAERKESTLFRTYTLGRAGYHISYRRNEAANCNLRKNPGMNLVKQQPLEDVLPANKTVRVKLTKQGARITLEVDGKTFMDYTDPEKPHSGGRIAFRQVYPSSARYGNIVLKELK